LVSAALFAFAISNDVYLGVPGEGGWVVAILVPATTLPLSIAEPVAFMAYHYLLGALYVLWCFIFAEARGMGEDLWSPDGGNLVAIIVTQLILMRPYLLPHEAITLALRHD